MRLAAVPDKIRLSANGHAEAELAARRDGDWSPAEVLAHLRASDDILAYRAYAILVRDNPPLPAYDERRWAELAGYAAAPFLNSLDVYAKKRADLVTLLNRASLGDWERTGSHEVRGSLSLWDTMMTLVEHEEEHYKHLCTIFAHRP
jgi:hypothetical protein